jgi:predicted nucleic acid-binding protein
VALRRGWILATDDLAGRAAGRRLGVDVTGTLGALLQGVQLDLVSKIEAGSIPRQMIAAGYRSPVSSLDALLQE